MAMRDTIERIYKGRRRREAFRQVFETADYKIDRDRHALDLQHAIIEATNLHKYRSYQKRWSPR